MSADVTGMHHVAFTVSDMERSIAFWHRFGFEPDQRFQFDDAVGTGVPGADYELALLKRAGEALMLELIEYHGAERGAPPRNDEVGAAHVALRVRDIDALYEELRDEGVPFVSRPRRQEASGLTWVYAKDPDGITVELIELLEQPD